MSMRALSFFAPVETAQIKGIKSGDIKRVVAPGIYGALEEGAVPLKPPAPAPAAPIILSTPETPDQRRRRLAAAKADGPTTLLTGAGSAVTPDGTTTSAMGAG